MHSSHSQLSIVDQGNRMQLSLALRATAWHGIACYPVRAKRHLIISSDFPAAYPKPRCIDADYSAAIGCTSSQGADCMPS